MLRDKRSFRPYQDRDGWIKRTTEEGKIDTHTDDVRKKLTLQQI